MLKVWVSELSLSLCNANLNLHRPFAGKGGSHNCTFSSTVPVAGNVPFFSRSYPKTANRSVCPVNATLTFSLAILQAPYQWLWPSQPASWLCSLCPSSCCLCTNRGRTSIPADVRIADKRANALIFQCSFIWNAALPYWGPHKRFVRHTFPASQAD